MSCKRVLAILKGYLGDAVMTTPLLHGLSQLEGVHVEVLTAKPVIALLSDTFPDITFHLHDKSENRQSLSEQARELQSRKYDIAFVVNRSFRAALLARLARIPVRVGHNADLRGGLLTHALANDKKRYEAACYLDLASRIGLSLPDAHPKLVVPPESVASVSKRLDGATIGIQPGASGVEKRIPIPVLASIVNELQKGNRLALLGGPDEVEAGRELQKELSSKPMNFIGELSLKESTAAVSQLEVMIGADTGLMHIAAATGCPTVTMFGKASMASKWGHHYEPHQILKAPGENMAKFDAGAILASVQRVLCT